MLKGVHHIAYVVTDLDAAVHQFVNVFGGTETRRETIAATGIEVSLVQLGNMLFELVKPVSKASNAYKFLQDHGPGVYHIAFEVGDIDAALTELTASGVDTTGAQPAPGVDWTAAWLKPTAGTLNVLTQLIEPKL